MIYYISRYILWVFFKIFFRYKAVYTKRIPKKGSFIIASNHLSFLDPAAVGLITKRGVSFLARASLFNNGLFAWWAKRVGVIPISRGRLDLGAIRGSLKSLGKGRIVALFPEGTRSKDGSIQDPKSGVGFLAVKAGVPVVPILITGSDKALPMYGMFIRLKPIEVRVAEPVLPEGFLQKNGEYNYQALSKEVMKRIGS